MPEARSIGKKYDKGDQLIGETFPFSVATLLIKANQILAKYLGVLVIHRKMLIKILQASDLYPLLHLTYSYHNSNAPQVPTYC